MNWRVKTLHFSYSRIHLKQYCHYSISARCCKIINILYNKDISWKISLIEPLESTMKKTVYVLGVVAIPVLMYILYRFGLLGVAWLIAVFILINLSVGLVVPLVQHGTYYPDDRYSDHLEMILIWFVGVFWSILAWIVLGVSMPRVDATVLFLAFTLFVSFFSGVFTPFKRRTTED